jgi:hypothetical protein
MNPVFANGIPLGPGSRQVGSRNEALLPLSPTPEMADNAKYFYPIFFCQHRFPAL